MNTDGLLILTVLKEFRNPTPASAIIKHVADKEGIAVKDVKESVMKTLEAGVRFGFIQRYQRRYYADEVDLEEAFDSSDDDSDYEDARDIEDRARRRRRSRSRSRRRRSRRRRR